MDFESIGLYCLNPKNISFLKDYFYRKFKNDAELEDYSAKEFFSICLSIIEPLRRHFVHYTKEKTITIKNSLEEIYNISFDEWLKIRDSICSAYLKAVPLNKKEISILMRVDLDGIQDFIDRLPFDLVQQIMHIQAFKIYLLQDKEEFEKNNIYVTKQQSNLSDLEKLEEKYISWINKFDFFREKDKILDFWIENYTNNVLSLIEIKEENESEINKAVKKFLLLSLKKESPPPLLTYITGFECDLKEEKRSPYSINLKENLLIKPQT